MPKKKSKPISYKTILKNRKLVNMAKCPKCESQIVEDEGYNTIGRCNNNSCTEFNVPVGI